MAELDPTESGRGRLFSTSAGNDGALDELVPRVYHELRRMAAHYLGRDRRDHTLQPTALVHEAYLRLMDKSRVEWGDRAQFLAIAARTMRDLLVEHARRRHRQKRGGRFRRTSVEIAVDGDATRSIDLIALDEALVRLDAVHPLKREIVELRFFGGLTIDETAEALGISSGSVKRHWAVARAWLHRELYGDRTAE